MFIFFDILYILFIITILYFGIFKRLLKRIKCNVRITGVITSYKQLMINDKFDKIAKENNIQVTDSSDTRKYYYQPICTYTYEGIEYNEAIDYKLYPDPDRIGEELEFNINKSNPTIAIKIDILEILRMIIISLTMLFLLLVYISSVSTTTLNIEEFGLRTLGAMFIYSVLHIILANIIIPIKNGAFSKSLFDKISVIYSIIAILTVGSIFLILGVAFIMGEKTTFLLLDYIQSIINI